MLKDNEWGAVISKRMFWEAVRAGFFALESQRKIRPLGQGFAYDWEDIHLIVRTIATQLNFMEASMTDYGSIIRGDEWSPKYPDNDPPPRKQSVEPSKRCSTSNHFGKFMDHVANLRHILKFAEKDGFCLDELLNALPTLEKVISSAKSES